MPPIDKKINVKCYRCGGMLSEVQGDWLGQAWHRIKGSWYCARCILAMASLWVVKTKDGDRQV